MCLGFARAEKRVLGLNSLNVCDSIKSFIIGGLFLTSFFLFSDLSFLYKCSPGKSSTQCTFIEHAYDTLMGKAT